MRFLVVDDHPMMAEAIRTALLGLEHVSQVVCVASLEAALEESADEPPFDLVLLDLALPDCTSPQDALQRFREQRAQLPVVVVSAANDADTIVSALELGAMGFIPKTSARDVLLGAVRLVASGGIYVPVEALRGRSTPLHAEALITPLPAMKGADSHRSGMTPDRLGLTPRQADVLAFVLKGLPNKLIARKLDIAENTVKVHLSAVFQALNVSSRTQALIAATRMGLRFDE